MGAAAVVPLIVGGVTAYSADRQASAAKAAAEEQARAIRESAEATRQQAEQAANAAAAQQAAQTAASAARAKAEKDAADLAAKEPDLVEVDVKPKSAETTPSRKRAKFQLPTDPTASVRI